MLVTWAVQFMDWALQLFNRIKPNLEIFIGRVLKWLADRGPELLDKLWSWIQGSINLSRTIVYLYCPVTFTTGGQTRGVGQEQCPGYS
jgi:hypothetical protein